MREYQNICEQKFAALARSNGWTPSKRGWPDFVCFDPDQKPIAVEVKPRTTRGRLKLLKREQTQVMDFLQAHGVRCFVSDGETLEVYSHNVHASESRRRNRLRSPGEPTEGGG